MLVVDPSTKGGLVHHSFVLCEALSDTSDVTLLAVRPYELAAEDRRFALVDGLRPWVVRRGTQMLARIVAALAALVVVVRDWAVVVRTTWRLRPSVIHFQNVPTNHPSGMWFRPPYFDATMLRLVRRSGAAIVTMIHDVPLGPKIAGTSALIRASDGVITHRSLAEVNAPGDIPILVTPHPPYDFIAGLSVGRSSFAPRVPEGARIIVHAGYIEPYKGTDLVIEAFAAVAERVADAWLIVAGEETDPTFGAHCRSLARASAAADRIVYESGFLDAHELSALLSLASVVALPYRAVTKNAASGIAYAAIACGAQVVISKDHFADEALDESRVEWSDAGDVSSTALAIERALERGRGVRSTNASWPAIHEVLNLYDAAIARRKR